MYQFFKAQITSLISTLVDFSLTFFLVEICHQHYVLAVGLGAMAGALVNFSINRYWSFQATDNTIRNQSYRYVLVWTGSLILNMSGTYMLTQLLSMNYLVSKIITAICVGLGFNYTLQKYYVFATKKSN